MMVHQDSGRMAWKEEGSAFPFSLFQPDIEIQGGLLDQLWLAVEIVITVTVWFGRLMIFMLPAPFSSLVSNPFQSWSPYPPDNLGQSVSVSVKHDNRSSILVQTMPQGGGPIGRALFQVLTLVNDIPASSIKYEFARALADKMVQNNQEHGGYLEEVNRAALSAGFQRTLQLLTRSLSIIHRRKMKQDRGWPWSWILAMNPSKLVMMPLSAPISVISARVLGFCHQILVGPKDAGHTGQDHWLQNEEFAGKLAQEMLWLTRKMVDRSAAYDAVAQWASASSLALLSLTAMPRVKRSLVKLSVLLCRGLVAGDIDLPKDVKVNLLLLWLPLMCSATQGGDGSIFCSGDKITNEDMLEQLIKSLPEMEQEEVLSLWLHEFAMSPSDWPNLRRCYDNWCYASRKLGLPGNPKQITFDDSSMAIVKASHKGPARPSMGSCCTS